MVIGLEMALLIRIWTRPASLTTAVVPEPVSFQVKPAVIEMGAFYSGSMVRVEGRVENGSKLLVAVVGSDRAEHFNKKAKVGPIWLNSGKVHVSGVPSLFLRFSTEPVRALLASATIEQHRLDEASLQQQMRLEPHLPEGDAVMKANFLSLKQADGIYQFSNGGVRLGEPGQNGTPFWLEFAWPKKAPPATYQVRVYEIRDGQVIRRAESPLHAVRVGFPAWLAAFAEHRAATYGLAAVVFGALAGFGIDFLTLRLFGKKKRITAH